MRLARITALSMLMALGGCAILRPAQKPTQRSTINQAAQQIVSSTGAIIARAAPHRYGLTYGATGGSEVGSFPNASPLSGSERILADQNSQTVNILPSQIEQYLGLPVGLSFPLSVANGGTGTSSPGLIAGTNVTITGAWPDQTINSGASMVYPGAGLANSTGTAWSTSITTLAGLDSVLGITGTPSSTTYLRGDGTWATPSGSGTVNSGTSGQVGCYAATGTAISGCGLGNGLVISSGTLNVSQPFDATSPTTISCTADSGAYIPYSSASATAVSVPQATGACDLGFGFTVQNRGTGTVTLTPTTSSINGASSLAIGQNLGCSVVSDGTNYQVGACTALVTGGSSGITLENGGSSLGTITTLNCSTGTTCTASGGVGTLTASGGGGSQNAAFYTMSGPNAGVASNGVAIPLSNEEYVYSWNLPVPMSISFIIVDIQTIDATNDYSFALYNSSGVLECSTAPQSFGATGIVKLACSQGSNIALTPGKYGFGITGNATTMEVNQNLSQVTVLFGRNPAGTTSGGTSLSSITFPSENISQQTGATTPWFAVE